MIFRYRDLRKTGKLTVVPARPYLSLFRNHDYRKTNHGITKEAEFRYKWQQKSLSGIEWKCRFHPRDPAGTWEVIVIKH